MKTKKFVMLAMLLTAGLLLHNCSKDDDASAKGKAKLDIRLTDNPANYDEVNIHVIGVEIITDNGKRTLPTQSGIYNLLDYAGNTDTLIAGDSIDAGRINQIRLILGDSNTVVIDGITHNLMTPSAQQSGLKINVHKDLVPGVAYEWTLDFDAAKSIVETGNGQYILKPVIRLITDGISGSITGTFDPAAAAGTAYAISGSDTFGAIANSDGEFLIKHLDAGTYNVLLQPAATFSDTIINNVNVVNGQMTDIGNIQF